MSVLSTVLEVCTTLSVPVTAIGLLSVRATNRKLNAQAKKLDAENIDVLTGAAADLVTPLRRELAETRAELAETKKQVKELTAEVEHQRLVINESTAKLEAANRRADLATQRADYYQRAFDQRAEN